MTPSSLKLARRRAIIELLQAEKVHNHAELAALLDARGQAVNQATLSRDLRDLGVVKGSDGYTLSEGGAQSLEAPGQRLILAARQYLSSIVQAQNQVLLKTPPGGAQPLALALDAGDNEDLLGTLAGDDTILLIAADAPGAERLVTWLEGMR
ncbi:MAG TPA: arginine repressor [Planctomycetes bacterium]|nr:arginine repressor [Planctomycetota bacterium]HIK61386.1 arginine repressor [Planctomycetota bacterium]